MTGFPLRLLAYLSTAFRDRERPFSTLLQSSPDGVIAVDEHNKVVLANDQAHALFAYPPETLKGISIDRLVPGQFREAYEAHVRGLDEGPYTRRSGSVTSLNAVRRDGSEFPADVSLSSLRHGTRQLALAFIRDMSEQRAVQADLARVKLELETELQERRRMRAISELLQALRSHDEARSVLNLHLEHLFPQTSGAVLLFESARERIENLVDWGSDESAHRSFQLEDCWAARLGKPHGLDSARETAPCPHVSTSANPPEYLCVPLLADGETLGVFHICASDSSGEGRSGGDTLTATLRRRAIAVAERLALPLANLRLREQLRDQSIRDGLTGAFNRRYLEEALGRELARAARSGGYPVSVVMLDLDNFKSLNDRFGHGVGDDVLRTFGAFLMRGVRVDDIVCRYGGEEFAVILPGSTEDTTTARVETLRRDWETACALGRTPDRPWTTFSAGVSTSPNDGATADGLLEAADRALYQAKLQGRNRVVSASRKAATL